MINLLLGPPGGGKSYEAVAFHVLPALRAGRKVITNLPLIVESFAALDSAFPPLLEIRTETLAKPVQVDWTKAESNFKRFGLSPRVKPFNKASFSNIEDYGDPWRHPETGSGPLYVIDECHIPMPKVGTPEAVEVWYSLHRHESADVLLITQSWGKINRAIVDLVQVCYRVKKAVALGSSDRYIRKVQDGVRGSVVNENIRVYESKYFPLYKSHTRGGGKELSAQDIKPIWKHWSFIGAILFLVLGLGVVGRALFQGVGLGTPDKPSVSAVSPGRTQSAAVGVSPVQAPVKPVPPSAAPPAASVVQPVQGKLPGVEPIGGPYDSLGLHLLGSITNGRRVKYLVLSSLNGQPMKTFDDTELEEAGYKVEPVSPMVARLSYGNKSRWLITDGPQVSLSQSASPSGGPASASSSARREEGPRVPRGEVPRDNSYSM